MNADSPEVPHVQTRREVQAILAGSGLRPNRRFGQNFLVDGNLMRKLLDEAGVGPSDTVLEVGGGTGGLTDLLAAAAGSLVVVEIDRALAPMLRTRFSERPHVTVLETDVLTGKHTIAPEVLEALQARPPRGGRYMLVANLPYNVATPLIMNLLTARPRVDRMCFTIQKEVALRMTATPGGKEYGPLAIAAQTVCRVDWLAKLPPSAFWPAPKVESAMLRLERQSHAFATDAKLQAFIDLVHAGFAHRRKTLRHNLAHHFGERVVDIAGGIVDLSRRAEQVPLERWIELGVALCQ